tara:strand:- start:303 stop:761 length:459 start_codon:yes stop_codon:yes gene_type:complete
MKGISFIVILSIVWSIVASIIEKRKVKAKQQHPKGAGLRVGDVSVDESPSEGIAFQADPVEIKVERLQREKKAQLKATTNAIQESASIKKRGIKALHDQDCSLPPTTRTKTNQLKTRLKPSRQIASMLRNKRNLKTAIVLAEVLGPPISQKH